MKSMKSLKNVKLSVSLPSISATTRMILTILILGVGVVLVVVLYGQQQTRNNKLSDEVDGAATTLVQNSLSRRDLENRLVAANLTLAELTANFPSSKQSMDVEEALYKAAADAGVGMKTVSCSVPKAETVGSSSYGVYMIAVSVTGDTQSILRFVGIVGNWLPSTSIESATLRGSGEAVTLALNLKVYAQAAG